jgi:hypothetical protein
MSAVVAFSIDTNWNIPPLTVFKETINPWTRPYILLTSQWQQWNLFSPDPLRRISQYHVEQSINENWHTILSIDASLPYPRRAGMTKTLRRLEDRGSNDALTQRFLALVCRDKGIPEGMTVRLQRTYSVLPHPAKPLSAEQWRAYEPLWTEDTLAEIPCPAYP